MLTTRRSFLSAAAVLSGQICWGRPSAGFKIGVTDWSLGLRSQPEAFALASQLGFDGLEVGLGRTLVGGHQKFQNSDLQARYLAEIAKCHLPVAGIALNMLSVNPLKSDPQAAKWVVEAISIASKLDAKVVLLPFFGKSDLKTQAEMEYTADALRELGPEAEKAHVLLGLENYRSAEDNVRMMERAGSRAVQVYYDVGNSTFAGFDVIKEIRWLGRERIAQVHLKDSKNFLGEGRIDFPAVLHALADIGFQGFANLETEAPSGSVEADMRKNLRYVRGLMEAL